MKKVKLNVAKLQLQKETIAALSGGAMYRIRGGEPTLSDGACCDETFLPPPGCQPVQSVDICTSRDLPCQSATCPTLKGCGLAG